MKKTFDIILVSLIFFIIYFLQSNFFTWFNIAGVMPNLFVILVTIIGLFMKKEFGFGFGIVLGLLLDFFIGTRIGIYSITFGIIGLIAGFLDKNFSKDNRLTLISMISFLTLITELIIVIIGIVFMHMQINILQFLKIVIIEVIFNSIIVLVLYPLIIKLGNRLENDFIRNNKIINFLY